MKMLMPATQDRDTRFIVQISTKDRPSFTSLRHFDHEEATSPYLSEKMGSKLRQLTPVMHLPAVVSARQEALQGLKKISAIQVSHAAEKDRYVVDVCAEDRPNSTSTPKMAISLEHEAVELRRTCRSLSTCTTKCTTLCTLLTVVTKANCAAKSST